MIELYRYRLEEDLKYQLNISVANGLQIAIPTAPQMLLVREPVHR